MRRPLIALTAAAVTLGVATTAVAPAEPEVLANMNAQSVWQGLTNGSIIPQSPTIPNLVVPPPSDEFWRSNSGYVPILTTPPFEPPEILMPDVQNRMSILYVTDAAATAILGTSEGMRGLPWLFRQEPSNSGGTAALGDDTAKRTGSQRMWKVSGSALAGKPTAEAMAAMLKAAVNRDCVTPAGVNTCGAHLVGVDEIGSAFGTEPGQPDAGTPGVRLRDAMTMLAKQSFQPGVSYASRIHFYVAPGVTTAISAGLGPARTLGANGKEMRRDYSQVMSAMSRAGGVWLEMYHYPERGKPRQPFTGAEWRDVPTRFAAFLKERTPGSRNPLNYLHFVLSDTPGATPPPEEPCVATPSTGASSNALVVDPIERNQILDNLPACPTAPPPPCPVLMPQAASNALPLAARLRPRAPSIDNRNIILINNLARNAFVVPEVNSVVKLAVFAPDDSGMTCQWKRAQGGDVNTRILANGPAAFKVTGSEAQVFGEQFRQFFLIGSPRLPVQSQ